MIASATMPTILVVDDEPKIAQVARDYLEHAGYDVVVAGDGQMALERTRLDRPALVVLDLRLPGVDGLDVARTLRRESDVPIIMLTARVEESDRLAGLAAGADDYVVKPFSPRELVARVKAVLRRTRTGTMATGVLEVGDLAIDLDRRIVSRGSTRLDLTSSEFALVSALARHPGRVLSRAQLLDAIGGVEADAYDRAVDTHIKNIRRKLQVGSHRRYIATVYGVGYRFDDE